MPITKNSEVSYRLMKPGEETGIVDLVLRVFKASIISDKNPFSLMSTPIPILLISLLSDTIEANESIRITGRLSTQKKSESSSALRATVLPEPERPVIITIVGFTIAQEQIVDKTLYSCFISPVL